MDDALTHSIDKLVKYRTDDAVFQVQEYNLDLKAHQIYLFGEESMANVDELTEPGVEFCMANRFIRNLNLLQRLPGVKPILIHMKTNGGDWYEGMAMFDAIKACPNPITILNYTHARSMSSLIFCAADRRVMMPHSTFMFHGGVSTYSGTYKQAQNESKLDKKLYEEMLNIYTETLQAGSGSMSTWSTKKIRTWLETKMNKYEDAYLNSEETVTLGFADKVFGSDGTYDWSSLTQF